MDETFYKIDFNNDFSILAPKDSLNDTSQYIILLKDEPFSCVKSIKIIIDSDKPVTKEIVLNNFNNHIKVDDKTDKERIKRTSEFIKVLKTSGFDVRLVYPNDDDFKNKISNPEPDDEYVDEEIATKNVSKEVKEIINGFGTYIKEDYQNER